MRKRRLKELFDEVETAIAVDQPQLTATLGTKGILVSGTYSLNPTIDDLKGGGSIASYLVGIQFPEKFPKAEPIVREIGNAIPHNKYYHINCDGTCCICVWEAWASSTREVSVQTYFDGPLRYFFLGQHEKKRTGEWPFGEEAHGKDGIIDAFANRLSCEANEKKVRYLLRLFSKDWPKGHWECPCGSGCIIRKCCAEPLAELRMSVPKSDARSMLSRLERLEVKNARAHRAKSKGKATS